MPDFLLFVRKLFPLRSKNISSEEEKKSGLWGFRWVLGERKFRLMNQRDMEKLNEDYHTEKYLRHQQIHETLDLLALFEKSDTAKLVREVAVALMGGRYVNILCTGGGSVSSETGWDGRKKDEENEDFRLCCWLHAAKTVKASRHVPTKRKGYGR